MANGTEPVATPRFDPQARYGALEERVTNLRTSFVNFENEVRSEFTSVKASIDRQASEFRAGIAQLSLQISDGKKTQWPVIISLLGLIVAVLLGVGGAVGSLSLSPVREAARANEEDIKALLAVLPEKFIARSETEALRARSAEERERVEKDLDSKLSRPEWMLRNNTVDREIAELERRIDEVRQAMGDTYGVRDVILDLKAQVQQLQQRLEELRAERPLS